MPQYLTIARMLLDRRVTAVPVASWGSWDDRGGARFRGRFNARSIAGCRASKACNSCKSGFPERGSHGTAANG